MAERRGVWLSVCMQGNEDVGVRWSRRFLSRAWRRVSGGECGGESAEGRDGRADEGEKMELGW